MPRSRVPPIDIVHLAYTTFPDDPRVKREALAVSTAEWGGEGGHRVAVVALRPLGARAVERHRGVTVIRVPGRKSRPRLLGYLRQYAGFVWRCRCLLARHPRLAHVKLVHVHTLPDFLVWAATPARRRGAKLIFDMHEIFPEFARSRFSGALGRLASTLARALERQARSRADLTIVANQPIAGLLDARPLERPERRIVIHNSADPLDLGPPISPAPRASRGSLELIYHGTLTLPYGVDGAVRGVLHARQRGADARLSILGDGPERSRLEQLVVSLSAAAVIRFEHPLPQRELRARLGRADAVLVPTRLDAMTRYSLSNKLLEAVHLGIPVLAARLPSYSHYLDDASAWFWNPGDATDLVRAILAFARATPEERCERARAAQRALQGIAWPVERGRLLDAYRHLLEEDDRHAARMVAIRSAAPPSP